MGLSALLTAAGPGEPGLVLAALAIVLVSAKLAGEVVERLKQPAVLGELVVGIVLGNLAVFGGPTFPAVRENETFAVLAELGAILLLFQVGLESTPMEMLAVGGRATVVALVGIALPMGLGYAVSRVVHPGESWMSHAFVGAMLAATSVGITARVLKDADAIKTRAARIILGAAVIDDVLGLLVLAVISGIITAASEGTAPSVGALAVIVLRAVAFLVGALLVGSFLSPRIFRGALALRSRGLVLVLALAWCFLLSWLAMAAGLAAIVGAFAAGLVLEGVHFAGLEERGEPELHASLVAISALFVPVFFVRMGVLVDVQSFASPDVLTFAVLLTVAACVGKWACGLVVPPGVSPTTVGVGMMPRGEVGLIFAGIGAALVLDGKPVIGPATYAAAVFMVVVTTMATPPLLLRSLRGAPEPS
jgi:Na+:H+ antiporter